MKRYVILTMLIAFLNAPVKTTTMSSTAASPSIFIGGDNGFFGVDRNGEIHFVITSDGFRYYDVPTYGFCNRHHCNHYCRFVPPGHYKHHKKYYKKMMKDRKKYYKKLEKDRRKYYKKHGKHHHHHHHHDD